MTVKEMVADVGYYTPIKAKVLRARENFLLWADSLPYPINEITRRLSRSNKEGPLPGALLGERYAFLVGELLGAVEEIEQEVAKGCIAGFTYIIIQDHCIDEETQTVLHNELIKNLLYAKLIESFKAVTKDEYKFWHYFNLYLREYTDGCLWENIESRHPKIYSRQDLRMVANRTAMVKNCASSLAIATGKEQEIPKYCSVIEDLVIGLQIRDDLADLVEDLDRDRYTYPMSRLLSGKQASLPALKKAVLYSSKLENLLEESTKYLGKVSTILDLPESSALQLYLDYISIENNLIKSRIIETKTSLYLDPVRNLEIPLSRDEALAWDTIHKTIRNDIQY